MELEVLLGGEGSPWAWVVSLQGTENRFLQHIEASAYFSQVNRTPGKKCLVFYKTLLK